MSTAVLGATGAVGAALSRRLFARGVRPWLIGRSQTKLEALSAELGGAPCTALDVTDIDAIGTALAGHVPDDVNGLAYCIGDIVLKPLKRAKR